MAFGAVVGYTAFFITHGFKQNAELKETTVDINGSLKSTTAGDISLGSKVFWDGNDFKYSDVNSKVQGLNMETFKAAIRKSENGKKFLDSLSKQGVDLSDKKIDINISDTSIGKGKISGKVALDTFKTTVGNAKVSVEIDNMDLEGNSKSAIKGNISIDLTPNEINKLINSKIKEMQKAGTISDSFKIDAKLDNGKISANADTWYAGAQAGIKLEGNKITLDIEKAKFIGIFSVRGMTADKIQSSLAKEGISFSRDHKTLTLDARQIFKKYINDTTEISNANLKGNNLSFDFIHK